MKREIIASENAPAAVGPYSQAVRIGNLVYTAGQIALDPATGKLITADTPEETIKIQTRQVLNNLSAVLEAAGTSLANVIKTTVFLRSIKEYGAMNEVYAEFFPEAPPARSAFAVAALPLSARVEIEVVALVPEAAAEEPASSGAAEETATESVSSMLDEAMTSIESAVASGLRELSSFFAELQAQVEEADDDDDDDDDGEKEEKKEKKEKKKKGKKKDKKGKKKKKKD